MKKYIQYKLLSYGSRSESTVGLIGEIERLAICAVARQCNYSQRWFLNVLTISGVSGKAKFSKGSAYYMRKRWNVSKISL